MAANRGLVDAVLVEVLNSDPVLTALCPDGAWWQLGPAGLRAFVTVSIADGTETPALDRDTLYERTIYVVKAVVAGAGNTTSEDAAQRIHELLHHAELDLSPAGYTAMVCRRIEPVNYTEIDPAEKSARWQHRGGQYELVSYPTPEEATWRDGMAAKAV
jgi:hypothetical protein